MERKAVIFMLAVTLVVIALLVLLAYLISGLDLDSSRSGDAATTAVMEATAWPQRLY